MLGATIQGTASRVSHHVAPDDREPNIPLELQPAQHVVDLLIFDVQLRAQYGLHEDWAVELSLPVGLVRTDAEFFADGGGLLTDFASIHHRDEVLADIGDPDLGVRWVALSGELGLELRAGVSLPFGRTEPDPYALGRMGLTHTHQFPGSGTLVPTLGLDTAWHLDETWSVMAWATARLPLYASDAGYRASRAVTSGVLWAWTSGVWRLQLGPELRVESTAQWSGRDAENSGRTDLLAAGAVVWSPAPAWQLHLTVEVPLLVEASGSQVSQPLVIGVGVRRAFDLGS